MEQRKYGYCNADPCCNVSQAGIKRKALQGRDLAYEIRSCKRRGAVADSSGRLYHAGDSGVAAYDDHAAVFYGAKDVHHKMLFRGRGFKKPRVVGLVCKHLRAVTHETGGFT